MLGDAGKWSPIRRYNVAKREKRYAHIKGPSKEKDHGKEAALHAKLSNSKRS